MKRTILSIKELEKIFKCRAAVVALLVIIAAPCVFLVINLLFAKDFFSVLMIFLFMSIFFWLFCFNGIKDLIGTYKLWNNIKNKRFVFYIRYIRNIKMINVDVDYNHHIYLSDGTMIRVTDSQGRKLSIGDTCYGLYFEGDKLPTAIFDIQKYELDDELWTLLKND